MDPLRLSLRVLSTSAYEQEADLFHDRFRHLKMSAIGPDCVITPITLAFSEVDSSSEVLKGFRWVDIFAKYVRRDLLLVV